MTGRVKNGLIFALVTAMISGFSIFYNKVVIVQGLDPLIFNIMKNGGVAVVLLISLVTRRKLPALTALSPRKWMKLSLIGLIGGSIPFILFFEGLRSVSAVNANLIHKTLFIWVALFAIPILGERLSIGQIIGYVIIAWSNIALGGFTGLSFGRGEQLILLATVLWSVENIIAKVALKDTDSSIVAWSRMAIGSMILILIAVIQGKFILLARVTPHQWFATLGSILFLSGYVLAWYRALSRAPATLVASVLILATPVTNVLSAAFLTHTLPYPQVTSFIGTLGGLLLITILMRYPVRKNAIQTVH